VLPGESIAKYRGASTAEPPAQSAPAELDESASSSTASGQEPHSTVVAPHIDDSQQSRQSNENAKQRYDEMNVASVFGGDEATAQSAPDEREVETERVRSELDEHHHDAEETATFEPEPHAEHGAVGGTALAGSDTQRSSQTTEAETRETADQPREFAQHEFAPGAGHLEEETIDEEEAEPLSLDEGFDEDEFEELEEQIMDRVAERAGEVAAGLQLTDAVEESVIERRAEEGYEGLESEIQPAEIDSQFSDEAESAETEQEEEHGPEPNGRAEMRAPASTAGFQQRTDRGYFDRRRAGRGNRRGGPRRPFRRHEPRALPQISDLLKEGQEILVQIAKEPIA
jgi:ribonuclease G